MFTEDSYAIFRPRHAVGPSVEKRLTPMCFFCARLRSNFLVAILYAYFDVNTGFSRLRRENPARALHRRATCEAEFVHTHARARLAPQISNFQNRSAGRARVGT